MRIEKPENENYAAVVTKIGSVRPLEGCDNVVGTTLFGLQAIVNKDTQVGDIGVFFPAESQLSDEYCYQNNLYRHSDKNKVESEKGYIEDNRRVKAVKFRGHVSSCLFMPLESLEFTGVDINELQDGDTFDKLNGKEICRKYVIKRSGANTGGQKAKKEKFIRVDTKLFPENTDTPQYFRLVDKLNPDSDVVVTQKLHGTSIRIGNTIVKRKLNPIEKFLKKFGIQFKDSEYDYVYGSRRVVKDINNPNQNHYYKHDIWTTEGSKLQGLLPENFIVYAELVGYTEEGSEIQKDYHYGILPTLCEMYIYRIITINSQGYILDLTWDQIKEFCSQNGLNHVPEVWKGKLKDLKVEEFLDKRLFDEGYRSCLSLGSNDQLVDEGVCVRVEGLQPQILKAKSQKFLLHETMLLDKEVPDMEATQL